MKMENAMLQKEKRIFFKDMIGERVKKSCLWRNSHNLAQTEDSLLINLILRVK